FHGGVRVAVGDLDGDGRGEILAAAGPGGIPYAETFNGLTLQGIRRFTVFDPRFPGGVYVAAAFLDGSGLERIVVGAGANDAPERAPVVRDFDGSFTLLRDYQLVYSPGYDGGVAVAGAVGLGRPGYVLASPADGPDSLVLELDSFLHAFSGFEALNLGSTRGL